MYNSKLIKLIILGGVLLAQQAAQAAAPAAPTGRITAREFLNIAGTTLPALTDSPKFPNSPDVVAYPTVLEWPSNPDGSPPPGDVKNNYGVQIVGYIYPPTTGDYQFAIAADDNAVLYLSTDDNPANKVEIAREPSWNQVRKFATESRRTRVDIGTADERMVNVSKKIRLTAGRAYYIEALMKEGGGGDNLAVAWAKPGEALPQDDDPPIPGQFLAPFATVTQATIISQPKDAAVLAGSPVTFSVGVDVGPTGTISNIRWQRNGVDIPNSNTNALTITAAAADDGAKYKAIVTTSVGTVTTSEATLSVASLLNEFAQGVVKFEAWTGIGGTSVSGLVDSPDFQTPPDDVRLLGSLSTPNGYGDNYGARLSGFITPQETGSYRFFIRSDDASQLFLSTDDKEANATMIAEETGCCDPFRDPGNPETSEPVNLVAGRRYAFYAFVKEGGGGDYLQIAWRKEGDNTPVAGLQPLSGNLIGANAKISKGDVTITKQPAAVSSEEGRTLTLSVEAFTTPQAFNLPLLVQWQKNGQNIAGATSTTLTIPQAKLTDTGKYRAVLSVAGVKDVNTAEVDVTVTPDTAGPIIAAIGAVKKGADIELGIAYDEAVDAASASAAANYTVSKGTIKSARYVSQSGGAVLVVSGLVSGDQVTVTAKNIKDIKGNLRDTTSKAVTIPAKVMSWVGIGGDELNTQLKRTDFNDDVVARSEKDFDLISGGSAHWTNYDEATFVYEEITGDFDKVVRVEYQDPVTQWSRAGLDAREALDEGKTRDDVSGGYKFSQHFTIRVNPPAVVGWDGRTGNNAYEVIHRPVEGANYDGFNAIFNIQNGSSNPPNYPNAWMRLKRVGQKLTAYRSSDGKTWNVAGEVTYQNDPDTPEDERLADKLFVGIFYAPEFLNINDEAARASRAASIAKFRDYGNFGAVSAGGIQSVTRSGANIVITFTGALQQADAITGPWTDVTGSSPLNVPISGTAKFFRVKR